MSDLQTAMPSMSLLTLPDELLLGVFALLDIPDLMAVSRASHHFRRVALDRLLHLQRLRASSLTLSVFLPNRPPLYTLQPPVSSIYLSRTHVAARKLGFSLALVAVNRSLSRRPPLSSLVNANIVPKDCCRKDRQSGQMHIATGGILERKRKIEKEKVKEGLRVWLEKKAAEIGRKSDVGVGILVWRFSKRAKLVSHDAGRQQSRLGLVSWENAETGRVRRLRRFWEGLNEGLKSHTVR